MSAIIVAGNEIIPDTLTVTVDGTEITAKDFQKVLLNINQASATASVADGTDLMQKMEIINKNANACDVSFKGEGGATVKNLKQNQSMRLSWTGSFWYVTFGGLLSGVANDGTSFNYSTEVTLDEVPVNTTYTTTEQDTGMTWIDGKKIYRKVIYIPSLPNATVGNYDHNISNLGTCWIANGSYFYASPYRHTVPFINYTSVTSCVIAYVDNTYLYIQTGANRTDWSAYIVLEYTKTTD